DGYSRRPTRPTSPEALALRFRFGVPADGPDFLGDDAAAALFNETVARLEALGGERVAIDFAPFREAARLLYEGPWVAERLAAIDLALWTYKEDSFLAHGTAKDGFAAEQPVYLT
ncbi:DNA polymerase III subunit chi, partial [Microbacteriaceae bacterium K1510]|nr:DNA polymerase III subunit chi [Microbacteriaceae bacterium K1510]